MKKLLAVVGVVGAALAAAPAAFAQTPTITAVSSESQQLLVNGVASIQTGLVSIATTVWPYVLIVMLFFLAIRFGMGFFRHH